MASTAILCAAAPGFAAHPFMTDAPENKGWYAPPVSGEAVYIGEPDDAGLVITLRKGPIAANPLRLAIVSDAKSLVLESAGQTITILNEPNIPNLLTLDGNKFRPRIRTSGQELSALRGAWVKMFVLAEETTLAIRFPHATFANIEFLDDDLWTTSQAPASGSTNIGSAINAPDYQSSSSGQSTSQSSSLALGSGQISISTKYPDADGEGVERPGPIPSVIGKRPMRSGYDDPTLNPKQWSLSLNGGVHGKTAYFYRGIGQENQDIIFQTDLEGVMRVWRSFSPQDLFKYLDIYLGLANSHHWGPTGRDNRAGEKWYEIDIAGGARVGLLDRWELELGYVNRSAPSNVFTDVHQLEFGFLYNDADPGFPFQLWPHLLVSIEFDEGSDASNRIRVDTEEGIYLELGVRPEFDLFQLGPDKTVKLTVPATVGLSVSDYYEGPDGEDKTFGYFDIGLELSAPASEVPAEGGRSYAFRWEAGVHFLFLGDTTEALSEANGTGGDSVEIIGSIGFTMDH